MMEEKEKVENVDDNELIRQIQQQCQDMEVENERTI